MDPEPNGTTTPADPAATQPGANPAPVATAPAEQTAPPDNAPKGAPSEEQKARRVSLEAELEAAKGREAALQAKLDAAQTKDDVDKAVAEAQAAAAQQVKDIAVNAALAVSGCVNPVALIAAATAVGKYDPAKVEVSGDGKVVGGLDEEKLKEAFPYLFGTTDPTPPPATVHTAANPGGNAQAKPLTIKEASKGFYKTQ